MFPEGSGIDAQVTFVFPQGIAFLNTRSGHFYQPITLLRLGSILKLSTGLKRAVISCSFHLHLTSRNTLASRYRNISRNGKLLLYILYRRSNFTSRSTVMRWLQQVATLALSDRHHKGPVQGYSPINKGGCLLRSISLIHVHTFTRWPHEVWLLIVVHFSFKNYLR